MTAVVDETIFARLGEAALAAWNEGQMDGLDDYMAPDYVFRAPPFVHTKGLDEYKEYVADVRAAYPDMKVAFDDSVIQGNVSVIWGTISGTNTGTSPSTGAPPTGRPMDFTWCQVAHWQGDKVVKAWSYNDHLSMLMQLGIVQLPEPA